MQFIYRLIRNESGVTSIEYAAIAGLLSIAIAGGARAIGINLTRIFANLAANLQ